MNIRRYVTLIAVLTGALLVACVPLPMRSAGNAPTAPYAISTDQAQYAPGDNVMVTIRNASENDVTYSVCPLHLERLDDGQWSVTSRWPSTGSICAAMAATLVAGSAITTPVTVPSGTLTGTYRVIFEGLAGTNGAVLAPESQTSARFAVR